MKCDLLGGFDISSHCHHFHIYVYETSKQTHFIAIASGRVTLLGSPVPYTVCGVMICCIVLRNMVHYTGYVLRNAWYVIQDT